MVLRRVKGKNGRIYEYNYPLPKEGTGGKRRPYHHRPDFKYKEGSRHLYNEVRKITSGIRMQCLSRDKFSCQLCHKASEFPNENYRDLNIHYKDGNEYVKTPQPNNSLDNLVTLCDRCHLQLHFDTLERHKSIIALRNEGYKLRVIGEKFGISRQRVFRILKSESNKG